MKVIPGRKWLMRLAEWFFTFWKMGFEGLGRNKKELLLMLVLSFIYIHTHTTHMHACIHTHTHTFTPTYTPENLVNWCAVPKKGKAGAAGAGSLAEPHNKRQIPTVCRMYVWLKSVQLVLLFIANSLYQHFQSKWQLPWNCLIRMQNWAMVDSKAD